MSIQKSYDLYEVCHSAWCSFADGDSLASILKMVSEAIQCPIVVNTTSIHLMSYGVGNSATIDHLISTAPVTASDTVSKAVVRSGAQGEDPDLRYGYIFCNSVYRSHTLGRTFLLGCYRPFCDDDIMVAEIVARIAANEIAGDKFLSDNPDIPHFALLKSLLNGEPIDAGRLNYRLQSMNLKPSDGLYLIVIDQTSTPLSKAQELLKQCGSLLQCKLCALFDGYVVFIYNNKRHSPPDSRILREFLESNGLKCGTSRIFTKFDNIPGLFNQAKAALSIGGRLSESEVILDFERYAVFYFISLIEQHIPLEDVLDPRLMQLIEHDLGKASYLFETLLAYMENVNNKHALTEALHVHRSTLYYRLDKIREITGWDLNNGSDIGKISFSLNIYEYLNMFDKRGEGE